MLIGELAARHPHSIELVAPAIPGDELTFKFTCFQHAFELTDPPRTIVDIATLWPDVYPNAKFVLYLMDQRLTEVTPIDVVDGDVVVYFSNGVPTHAGQIKSGGVVSKWGTAHLWRHGLYEVPARYGGEVRFFHALTRGESQESFLRFAEIETGESFLPAE